MSNNGSRNLARGARVVLLALLFLGLISYLFPKNEICCMFSSCRSYGFPGTFLNLCKTTDSFQEAQLVNHSSALELLGQGWHPVFTSRMNDFFPSAAINLLLDLALAIFIAWLILKLISLAGKKK